MNNSKKTQRELAEKALAMKRATDDAATSTSLLDDDESAATSQDPAKTTGRHGDVQATGPPDRFLYSRRQTAWLLGGTSIGSIIRLEQAGRLTPIRLSRSPTAQVFFTAADVRNLVEEAADAHQSERPHSK